MPLKKRINIYFIKKYKCQIGLTRYKKIKNKLNKNKNFKKINIIINYFLKIIKVIIVK